MFQKYAEGISRLSLANVRPEMQHMARELLYFDYDSELTWLM